MKILAKSTLFSSAMLWLWSLGHQLALAQEKCIVNGREVPCEELGRQVKAVVGWGIGAAVLLAVLGILATVFWIMMIVHAATHQIENKAMWIILMVFTGVLGALIYYLVVKRKFSKQVPPPTMAAPQ